VTKNPYALQSIREARSAADKIFSEFFSLTFTEVGRFGLTLKMEISGHSCLTVTRFEQGSFWARAGVQIGDQIVSANDEPLLSWMTFSERLKVLTKAQRPTRLLFRRLSDDSVKPASKNLDGSNYKPTGNDGAQSQPTNLGVSVAPPLYPLMSDVRHLNIQMFPHTPNTDCDQFWVLNFTTKERYEFLLGLIQYGVHNHNWSEFRHNLIILGFKWAVKKKMFEIAAYGQVLLRHIRSA
jgi:hypothetical protein